MKSFPAVCALPNIRPETGHDLKAKPDCYSGIAGPNPLVLGNLYLTRSEIGVSHSSVRAILATRPPFGLYSSAYAGCKRFLTRMTVQA